NSPPMLRMAYSSASLTSITRHGALPISSLSTVILTVPAMEAMALYTGQPFQMAMTPVQTVMVFITLIACAINLNDGETNAIEGMTHFVLFATFIMLSLLGL